MRHTRNGDCTNTLPLTSADKSKFNHESEYYWRYIASKQLNESTAEETKHVARGVKPKNKLTSFDPKSEPLEYVKMVWKLFGPFDGLGGMCEGAAFAGLAIRHIDTVLPGCKFYLGMSPWKSVYPSHVQLYEQALSLKSLLFNGLKDLQYAQDIFISEISIVQRLKDLQYAQDIFKDFEV